MNEHILESSLYQEATYKLIDLAQRSQLGTEPWNDNNPWEIYAANLPADSEIKEVDSFISDISRLLAPDDAPYLETSFAMGQTKIHAYGAIAMRMAAQKTAAELESHAWHILDGERQRLFSLRSHETELPLEKSIRDIGFYLINVCCATGILDQAVNMAHDYAQQEAYRPEADVRNETHAISYLMALSGHLGRLNNSPDVLDASAEVLSIALANFKEDAHSLHLLETVRSDTFAKLYQQRPEWAEEFAQKENLYIELIEAMQRQGQRPPKTYFDKARQLQLGQEVRHASLLRLAKAYCVDGHYAEAGALAKSIEDTDTEPFRRESFTLDVLIHRLFLAAKDADTKKIATLNRKLKTLGAVYDIEDTVMKGFVARGDVDDYIAYFSTHRNSDTFDADDSKNFLGFTVPMCVKQGDIARAEQLIQDENTEYQSYGWYLLAQKLVQQALESNHPKNISIKQITTYIDKAVQVRADDDHYVGLSYYTTYKDMRTRGWDQEAKELLAYMQNHPDLKEIERKKLADDAIADQSYRLTASGEFGAALHGSHLPDPEAGTLHSGILLNVAGAIHRERFRRKQRAS